MIEISKELLSEVFNFEVRDFVQLGTDDVTYEVRFNGLKNGNKYNIINIYELAHKCKEWARTKGYELITIKYDCFYECFDFNWDYNNCYTFKSDSEVEAIFKACEWILDNKPL